jgi:hypothetical protein
MHEPTAMKLRMKIIQYEALSAVLVYLTETPFLNTETASSQMLGVVSYNHHHLPVLHPVLTDEALVNTCHFKLFYYMRSSGSIKIELML